MPLCLVLVVLVLGACTGELVEGETRLPTHPASGPSPVGDPVPIGVQTLATGLTSPVQLVESPCRQRHKLVVDQVGTLWALVPGGAPRRVLDLVDRIVTLREAYDDRGLLGLAFHPRFAQNGRLFVFYTTPRQADAPSGWDHTNVVAELRVRGGRIDPATERTVLRVHHPLSQHSSGSLAFGPDGKLYIAIGGGGARDDVGFGHVDDWYDDNAGGNGQDVEQNLLGNILRIDVDGDRPYEVPADNPFVGRAGYDEVWAYGFRNPYRMAFDLGGSRILISQDTGQELWEEINVVVRGGNYGWNVREGTHCFDAENPFVSPDSCPDVDPVTGQRLRDPVVELPNTKNGGSTMALIGGHVYRGAALPALRGRYVFGSVSSTRTRTDGRIYVTTPRPTGLWTVQELRPSSPIDHFIKGMGQGLDGEIYVVGSRQLGPVGDTGKVWKIVPPRS